MAIDFVLGAPTVSVVVEALSGDCVGCVHAKQQGQKCLPERHQQWGAPAASPTQQTWVVHLLWVTTVSFSLF